MTKKQLIDELSALRQKVAVLEESVAQRDRSEERSRLLYEESIDGYAAVNPEGYMQESEKKYRELINFLPITVFECDQKANITSVNQAALKTFGYAQEDLDRGLNALNIVISGDRKRAEEALQKVLIGKLIRDHEYTLTRKDGGTFPALVFSSPITHKGETVGLRGAVIDITGRKRAEEALISTNQRLNDIIEFLPDATFVIDNDKKVIAWNRAMEKMTGVVKEDVIGHGDYIYTVPFYGERRPHLLDLIDISDAELDSRYQYVRRNGSTLYAETYTPALYGGKGAYVWATGAPLFDVHGNRLGAIESIRDITERKQAEESLRKSETMLRSVFKAVPIAVTVLDSDRIIRNINDSTVDIRLSAG
jgi:PAS domain S-box-containing protein